VVRGGGEEFSLQERSNEKKKLVVDVSDGPRKPA